jgi:CheY-like chemotaxis protein
VSAWEQATCYSRFSAGKRTVSQWKRIPDDRAASDLSKTELLHMSLVGNLEDLGLGEILQIVSLSRKSGVLSLYSKGREGKIVFRQGQVISAAIDGVLPQLGKLLVKKGIIDNSIMGRALALQAQGGNRERLGEILTRHFSIQADVIEEVAREQIEKAVYTFFTWDEGSFDFELRDNAEDAVDPGLESVQYVLERGVNPQFLAMEGSRILDERRHRGEFPAGGDSGGEESELLDTCDLAFDLMQEEPDRAEMGAPTVNDNRLLVLVDDDDSVRSALVTLFSEWGYTVHDFAKTEDTLIKIDFLYRDGFRPRVLVDLIMPRMDGSGILGGIELVDLLHDNFPDLAVYVMADHHTSSAEQKIVEKGYPLLFKPRKAEIGDAAVFQAFAVRIRTAFHGTEPSPKSSEPQQTINLGDELCREFGDEFVPVSEQNPQRPGVSLLRSMLEELNNPSLDGGIILLVLRFAAEFMNRAVVFIVRENSIMGLGQFGISVQDGCADSRVRDLRIPVAGDHFFRQAIEAKMALKLNPDGTELNHYFLAQLGGGIPQEVFLGPVVSEGRVVALLYGDNLPEDKVIGDTDSLEIFLSQAGLAMEKALLQRRLREKGQERT